MDQREDMFCATCGRVLNHVKDRRDGTEGWVHPGIAMDTHDPEAVPRSEVDHIIYCCDFCSQDDAEFMLLVRAFEAEVADTTIVGSREDWALCWTCAALVSSGQWKKLFIRQLKAWEDRYGESMPLDARAEIWKLHAQVRANILGSVRPIQ